MARVSAKRLSSHREVIDLWPRLKDYAEDVGISYETAKQQRRRNSIADDHRQKVIDCANARGFRGVTFEMLTLTAPRRGQGSAS